VFHSSFLWGGGCCVTKSDFLEPTNNSSSLFLRKQEKRNAKQARETERFVVSLLLFAELLLSKAGVSERMCFFSLPFLGVQTVKCFPSFLCFLCFFLFSRCFPSINFIFSPKNFKNPKLTFSLFLSFLVLRKSIGVLHITHITRSLFMHISYSSSHLE